MLLNNELPSSLSLFHSLCYHRLIFNIDFFLFKFIIFSRILKFFFDPLRKIVSIDCLFLSLILLFFLGILFWFWKTVILYNKP
ncbi:hypothetical protein Hanom_Chr15g01369241 [Helianthus anomalus]